MKPTIPDGMAAATLVDEATRQLLCRECADPSDQVVLVTDDTYTCCDCGQAISASLTDQPTDVEPISGAVTGA